MTQLEPQKPFCHLVRIVNYEHNTYSIIATINYRDHDQVSNTNRLKSIQLNDAW